MTEFESQHELNDELLSAYLDGELLPEERAAVEARLAADPAAEQLFHQLRTVSQAMQGLPQEVVGSDLRNSILRKAGQHPDAPQAALALGGVAGNELGSANGVPGKPVDAGPTLSIGRTRRGWIWASLALAAAILLMVFQSEPDHLADLPAVARHDASSSADKQPLGGTHDDALAFRSLSEPAPARGRAEPAQESQQFRNWDVTAGEPAPAAVPQSNQRARGLQIDTAGEPTAPSNAPNDAFGLDVRRYSTANVPDASTTGTAADEATNPLSSERLAAVPSSDSEHSDLSENIENRTSLGNDIAKSAQKQDEQRELLVVRVVAKRTAIESNAFERLLERNGIAIEEGAAIDELEVMGPSESAENSAPQEKSTREDTIEIALEPHRFTEEPEALLVQASRAAIQSCLERLHEDTTNYAAVAVNDATTTDDDLGRSAAVRYQYFDDAKDASGEKLAERLGWAKYGRGNLPQEDESLDRVKLYSRYQQEGAERDNIGGGLGGNYGYAITPDEAKQEKERFGEKNGGERNQGRARRVISFNADGPRRGSSIASNESSAQGNVAAANERRQPAAEPPPLGLPLKAETGGRTLQVLFVLTPEEELAPSSATGDRPE